MGYVGIGIKSDKIEIQSQIQRFQIKAPWQVFVEIGTLNMASNDRATAHNPQFNFDFFLHNNITYRQSLAPKVNPTFAQ